MLRNNRFNRTKEKQGKPCETQFDCSVHELRTTSVTARCPEQATRTRSNPIQGDKQMIDTELMNCHLQATYNPFPAEPDDANSSQLNENNQTSTAEKETKKGREKKKEVHLKVVFGGGAREKREKCEKDAKK